MLFLRFELGGPPALIVILALLGTGIKPSGTHGVGEHVQDVVLGFLRVEARIPGIGRLEGLVGLPVRLPFGFNRFEGIVGQGKTSQGQCFSGKGVYQKGTEGGIP